MKAQFLDYLYSLYRDIPQTVYEGMAIVLLVGVAILMIIYGIKKGAWLSLGLLLLEYIFLLFSSTVLFRASSEKFSGYDLHPFWSYRAYLDGREELLVENVMNVVVFVPVGFLIGTQIAQKKLKGWLVAILVGSGLSVGIETLQFVYKKGFAEVDDVMHNTIGCLIGYGLFKLIRSILLIF